MPDAVPRDPRSLAGEADRDRLMGVLRDHFAGGTIDLAELNRRAGIILAARYTDEAAAAVGDLPLLVKPAPAKRVGRRRHGHADVPGPGWVPTAERFRDPSSGVLMRVWLDPADHSRHYVPDSDR